jgi:hypothetical protein
MILWLVARATAITEDDVGEACWHGDQVRVHYGCLDTCWELVDVHCWVYYADDTLDVSTEWEIAAVDGPCDLTCVDLFVTCETIRLTDEVAATKLAYGGRALPLAAARCD